MSESAVFEGLDQEQVRLMEERVILVDREDNIIGDASKKESHLMVNINNGMLHRAFSVFLFDSQGRLLLQQRASEKITFPDYWTNTCCSHPLHIPDEINGVEGAKRAAIRKLEHELGIPTSTFAPDDFTFLTRLHYKSDSDGSIWGEHEVDYILFVQKDVVIDPNLNEVRDTKYMTSSELADFLAQTNLKFTPWFKLIADNFLNKWWSNLSNLQDSADVATIHHL